MATLHRTSTVSQSPLETLAGHREQQVSEPTGKEAFIPKELPELLRLEAKIAYPSPSPKDHVARKSVSPEDATSESIARIVGGFVGGVVLAISHHFFLVFLNGRNINEYPQYWLRNANNAFSAIFSLCIAFAATSSLTQMKWNAARSKPLSIRSIDNLIALPSPLAVFTTVTSTRLRSLRPLLLPIFSSVFIQALPLVSVFAPNALTSARSPGISRNITVPTLDLSKGPITSISSSDNGYTVAPQSWTTALTSIMVQPPLLNWKIPPGCGGTCSFELLYDAPGLQCTDAPSELVPYSGQDTSPLVYNGTSTLYPTPRTNLSSPWEIEDRYELRIGYIATNGSGPNTGRDGRSVHCVFRNATYRALFRVKSHAMRVKHSIKSYGGILGTVKYGKSDFQCSQNGSQPCFINGVNTRVMCNVFASAFTGKIQVIDTDHGSEATGDINLALIKLLFLDKIAKITNDSYLEINNPSKSLVSLFSNLTLGSIPYQTDTTTVQANIWDEGSAWSYTVWILWAVYLPALLLASLVMLNGLLSIRSNKQGMDDKFSNFLLTTRSAELDDVCMDVEDFAKLQQLRLLYRRDKGTFSVVSTPSEGVEEKM